MKCMVYIKDYKNNVIYKGKVLNLPIKKESIKAKCIELFNDDDPCIIHESYAISKFADEFINAFNFTSQENVSLKGFAYALDFIDIPNLGDLFITLEVKK